MQLKASKWFWVQEIDIQNGEIIISCTKIGLTIVVYLMRIRNINMEMNACRLGSEDYSVFALDTVWWICSAYPRKMQKKVSLIKVFV